MSSQRPRCPSDLLSVPASAEPSGGCWLNYAPAKCCKKKKRISLIKACASLGKHEPADSSFFPGEWNDGELDLAVKKDEFLCTERGQLGGLPFQSILSGKRFKTKGKQPFLTSWTGAKLTLATQASLDRSLARLMALPSCNYSTKTTKKTNNPPLLSHFSRVDVSFVFWIADV